MKLLLLVTLLGYRSLTQAATCSYSCKKTVRTTTWCWGWTPWACTAYRQVSGTCYKTCVNGGWSGWTVTSRGSCSVECDGGTQTVSFRRYCNNPSPSNGGSQCSGSDTKTERQSCNTQSCPVHGGWSAYRVERVGDCSVSCGGGQQSVTSTRTCTNPAPRYGGRICQGDVSKTESRTCNDHPCPIHGGWSAYRVERVGDCSVSCGGGQQNVTSTRTCTNPAPRYGGRICQGDVSKTESRTCNDHPCPIHGGWSAYRVERVGDCSVACGGGQQSVTSTRTCTNPAPRYGGRICQGDVSKTESRTCNDHPCPTTLAQGDETKVESRSCNSNPCPIDGGWSDWDDWRDYDECNALCGNGTKDQWRMRRCDNPAPAHGGRDCEGVDKESGTVYCNTQACGDLCPDGANTYLTNTNNTGRYYQCDHGVARLMACSDGTVWDQATTACVHDTSNPDCADGTVWDEATETCVHDTSNPGCADGTVWDEATRMCVHNTSNPDCADGTVWDEATRMCVHDTSNPDCADGTVWDEATRMCVHDTSNPDCADGTVWDEATRMCVHDTSNPDCADGTVWDEASASCVHDGSQQMNQGDQCDSSVLMPHQDCTKYILCSTGVAHVMSCPPGLRYNDAAKGCDF
ncbi:hypothetical protein BaRGS_00006130, partial [Batillaria attramentaria]